MERSGASQDKKVPPLKIKINVDSSLRAVSTSDEDDPLSGEEDSSSENGNLIIDEKHVDSLEDGSLDGETIIVDDVMIDEDFIDADFLQDSSQRSSCRQSTTSEEQNVHVEPISTYQETSANIPAHSSKGSRRKSHHVPKQADDVVFEEATIISAHDDELSELNESPNRHLMKNISTLRSCLNYVLEQQGYRPMSFKHNSDNVTKLIEQYNQMKNIKSSKKY
ncbi:uncharacterized protein LOC129778912 [Toxorhynchites rutilus septentrionalis]|uniref:uncharacterized protein LOC129778912 n=1 Tax=Toxorhynchites rutilus septentrionalis TaxID=329112 RepID=UPI002479292A|nr:uncharacterized protein LOC129778912 [Toxorhynchites rutilus septentrionalis]